VNWTVVVRGRDEENPTLGRTNWVPDPETPVWNLSRTRISGSNSLGVITNSGDESFGLNAAQLAEMERKLAAKEYDDRGLAARMTRDPSSALLLIYPISRFSGHDVTPSRSREPIYADPDGPLAYDLVGLAVSFPQTKRIRPAEAYLEGTARWRPVV
jgi:hypothetical protein